MGGTVKPHLSKDVVDQATSEICMMPFFPGSDPNARAMVIKYLFEICNSDEQTLWLSKRYVTLFPNWAGLRELRAVASSKFRPRDGVEVYSEGYPDGIPSEKESRPMIEAPPARQRLTEVSADPEARQMIADLMKSTEFPQ